MKHVMIDLETLSTRPTAAIVSIAAVAFNIETGETGPEFYCPVDVKSCIDDLGMTIDADTILWWMNQSKKVQSVFHDKDRVHLIKALNELELFMQELNPDTLVWSNPASFDLVILRNAYEQHASTDIPWQGKNQRCLHTLSSLFPKVKKNTEFIGTRHNALDDCHHQIKYCREIWSKLLSGQVAIKSLDSLNALM